MQILFKIYVFIVLACLLTVSTDMTSRLLAAEPVPAVTDSRNGPCRMIIQGNSYFSADELMAAAANEIAAYHNDGYRLSAVDDAAFQMEYTYRLAGFAQAVVVYNVDSRGEDGCRVLFTVREGSRKLIQALTVIGNNSYDGTRLLSFERNREFTTGEQPKPQPYVEWEISGLARRIRNFYLLEGYLDVKVETEIKAVADSEELLALYYRIHEGKQYRIGAVVFTGDVLPRFVKELDQQKQELLGSRFQQRQRLILRSRVEELYKNEGYADVVVTTGEEKDRKSGTVSLTTDINSGERVRIDAVEVSGLSRTRESFVRRRLTIKAGEYYNLAEMRESFAALYGTGLFQSVDMDLEKGQKAEDRRIKIHLEEKSNREFFVEPGWGSYELLRLAAGYRDRNLFGNGHRFRLETSVSTKGRSIETGITEPWLLGSDIEMDVPVYYRYREEPTFTSENSGFAVYLSKYLADNIQATAGYKNDKTNTTDIDLVDSSSRVSTSYTTAVMSLQLIRDTRDDYFFPTRGYRGFALVDVASPVVGGSLSFYRLKAGARMFWPMGKSSVLGMRYAFGIILPFSDQVGIPVGERFYNGGENSVRSFRESELGPLDGSSQPLGGAGYNLFSLEWRYKLTDTIASSLFLDAGNISPNSGRQLEVTLANTRKKLIDATLEDFFRDMQMGIGAGVQYLLPVGPARLDFAYNPNADEAVDGPDYVIHFSIGMAF